VLIDDIVGIDIGEPSPLMVLKVVIGIELTKVLKNLVIERPIVVM